MKVIFVELPYKARKIAVLEMFWKDRLGKFLILDSNKEACKLAVLLPDTAGAGRGGAFTSNTTKLSLSSPHRTIWEYVGSSSILAPSVLETIALIFYHYRGAGEEGDVADRHLLVQFPNLGRRTFESAIQISDRETGVTRFNVYIQNR